MVAAFRAGEALAGALEFAGEPALVTFVNRRIGAVIRHVVIAIIPHVFQRLQVVLKIRVFAITDEATTRERRVGRFEIDFIVRVYLLLHVQVEAVGVIPFVGHARHHAKLGGIEAAETVAQVLARRAVEAKTVAGFVFPPIHRLTQTLDNRDTFGAQRLAVIDMLVAGQRIDRFMDTDIPKRNRRAAVFENLRDIVIRFKTHAARAFHIENRCHPRFYAFETRNARHQRFAGELQPLIKQRPERGFIAFRLQRDARQVQANHAEVIAPVVDLLAVLFINAKETAAAHRRFKRAGHFHNLIVVEDIRVHALARALQRQLFDVIVRVASFMVQAVANREHQFREHCRFMVFTQPRDTVAQNRALDQTRFPAGSQTKTKGDERRLAVGRVQRVHFILQRLECVVALFFSTGAGVAFHIRDVPLKRRAAVLLKACRHKRGQHFVNAVDGGTAVDVARHLGDDLRRHGGGGGNRLRRFYLGVAHFKPLRQHAF